MTTFRIDGEYEDARHPKEVIFTSKLAEDLKRRDFTINAMAYNHRTGIVDLFCGKEDLKEKIIRCVGNAKTRFEEDALRIMRAVRFSAQLGFSIEEETKTAASVLVQNLERVSKERIQVELVKLLISEHPEKVRELYQMGISRVILPELDQVMELEQNNPYHCYTVGEHTIHMLQEIRADKVLRVTALLHDLGKPECHVRDSKGEDHFNGHAEAGARMAKKILRRLKFDNDTIRRSENLIRYHAYHLKQDKTVVRKAINQVGKTAFSDILRRLKFDNDTIRRSENLIRYHAYHLKQDKTVVRKAINQVGKTAFSDLLEIMEADTKAKSEYTRQERLDDIKMIRMMYEQS